MKAKEQDEIKRWEKKLCRESKSPEAMATSLCGYGYYDPNGVPKEAIVKYLVMGAEWQKEQMMKGLCFETKVYLESDGCAEDFNESEWLDLENTEITELPVDALGLKAGDKVKVIIVKED